MNFNVSLLSDEDLEQLFTELAVERKRRTEVQEIKNIGTTLLKQGVFVEYYSERKTSIPSIIAHNIELPICLYSEIVEGDIDELAEAVDYDMEDRSILFLKDYLPVFNSEYSFDRIEDWDQEDLWVGKFYSKGEQLFNIWFHPFTTEVSGVGWDLQVKCRIYFIQTNKTWIHYHETAESEQDTILFHNVFYRPVATLTTRKHKRFLKYIIPIR